MGLLCLLVKEFYDTQYQSGFCFLNPMCVWGGGVTCVVFLFLLLTRRHDRKQQIEVRCLGDSMVTMVTMGGDLQPGSLADRLLTGLGQPQINP